jgi:hypothetical protein
MALSVEQQAAKNEAMRQALPEPHNTWRFAAEAAQDKGCATMTIKNRCRKVWSQEEPPRAVKYRINGTIYWLVDPSALSEYTPSRGVAAGNMSRRITRANLTKHPDFFSELRLWARQRYGDEGEDNWTIDKQKSSKKSHPSADEGEQITIQLMERYVVKEAPSATEDTNS